MGPAVELSIDVARDDAVRLWVATIPGLPHAPHASAPTLTQLVDRLGRDLVRLGDENGMDWHGYGETLPYALRGIYR